MIFSDIVSVNYFELLVEAAKEGVFNFLVLWPKTLSPKLDTAKAKVSIDSRSLGIGAFLNDCL